MSDPWERARHFRNRAEECKRLADFASSEDRKQEYLVIAEHYIALAEAEEESANRPLPGERRSNESPEPPTPS